MPSVHSKPMYFDSELGVFDAIHMDYMGKGNFHFWIENNHQIIDPTELPRHPMGHTQKIYIPFEEDDQKKIRDRNKNNFMTENNCDEARMMYAIKFWNEEQWGAPPGMTGACYYNVLNYLLNHNLPNAKIVCGAFGYKTFPTTYDLCYGY